MKHVCIGIHVHEQPEKLTATLSGLYANSMKEVEILLLPDGPDDEIEVALESIRDIPQKSTVEPLGPPACFNRLAAFTDADVLVLLESGSLVGPGWLEHILTALDSDKYIGLAGPSTNQSWNEQCVFPYCGITSTEIALASQKVEKRFGKTIRTLEPLYSLGDFCYAVKREVVETIGAADEEYGLGPCWEMDYNIRAARAGFSGVWACAAYVHRSPFTTRRLREEKLHFRTNKRRYQDKFCSLKLESKRSEYCRHCEGEACKYFAQSGRIQIHIPFYDEKYHAQKSKSLGSYSTQSAFRSQAYNSQLSIENMPLVSCIMPTHNRRLFIPRAIQYFLCQDYPNRELIIVDDGTDHVKDLVPDDFHIHYLSQDQRLTIGAARNLACREAKGEIIVHWDDDDWIADWRLSYQVRNLLEKKADICGLNEVIFYDPGSGKSWKYVYNKGSRPWVAGNTLCYTKTFWNLNKFPDISVGEDTRFVWSNRPKNIFVLPDFTFFVAIIHSGNTSPKRTYSNQWQSFDIKKIQNIMGEDWNFYVNLFQDKSDSIVAKTKKNHAKSSNIPIVSCIMPTHNRRLFVPQAIKYFLHQDYPNKELIIVDDGNDRVIDLIPEDDRIKYIHQDKKSSIGNMRNLAVEKSKGEIIVHWDDDDWYSKNRISYQVQPLLEGRSDVCGIETGFIYDIPENSFWSCDPSLHAKMFYADIHGGSIVYFRHLWEKLAKYPDISLAEDAAFLGALNKARIVKLPNKNVFIYIRHDTNAWKFSCGNFINPDSWIKMEVPDFLPEEDYQFYWKIKEKLSYNDT